MREDAPYFNASLYCNRLGLRVSSWLKNPSTVSLLHSLSNYYLGAAHEKSPALIMRVKRGSRSVHGYYVHLMLHDALSVWCDYELLPIEQRPAIPRFVPTTTSIIYTMRTQMEPGSSTEQMEAARSDSRVRIANVISAAREANMTHYSRSQIYLPQHSAVYRGESAARS